MLDLKYRPLQFSDVLGQEKIRNVLQSRLEGGTDQETSYVFSGPHGSGKTTLARIFARAMLCQNRQGNEPCNTCDSCKNFMNEDHLNFEERDAAGHGTIDWVRATVDNLSYNLFGGKKIILFDESHRMSKDSQDVLLKPLEDRKLIGIFCTTELRKMRPAIRSRCELLQLERIPSQVITDRLELICKQEEFEYEHEALEWIVSHSKGHVRDAISSLEQVSKIGGISTQNVKDYLGIGWSTEILGLIESILSDDKAKTLTLIQEMLFKLSPQDIYSNILENLVHLQYLHQRLIVPNYFDLNQGVAILGQFDIELVQRFMVSFNRSLRFLDRSMLICEVLLTIEKLHRGYTTEAQSMSTDIRPASKATSTAKSKPLPKDVGDNDPEYLTPVDHAGINPEKRNDGYKPTRKNTPKKIEVSTTAVNMSASAFKKRFASTWGR